MKRILIVISAILLLSFADMDAQTMHYKRTRVALRAGLPGGAGLDIEHVFKATSDRLAVHATVGYLPLSMSGITYGDPNGNDYDMDMEINGLYYALGVKLYLLGRQEGLFFGVDYASQMSEVSLSTTESTDLSGLGSVNAPTLTSDYTWPMLLPKLGFTSVSEGGFFWGLEVGYGISLGEEEVSFDVESNGSNVGMTQAVGTGDAFGLFGSGFPAVALTLGWGF